jgi:hypothetical protein
MSAAGALEPGQQGVRVADSGAESDALDGLADDMYQTVRHGEEVPASVVAGEGVDLVHNDDPDIAEERGVVDVGADQHGLRRFPGGQQDVGLFVPCLRRCPADVSPCQIAARRPSQSA